MVRAVRRPAGSDRTASSITIRPTPPSARADSVGDEVVSREVVVNERRLVRGRDDAVLKLDRADA